MNIGRLHEPELNKLCSVKRILSFNYVRDDLNCMLPVLWETAKVADKHIGLDLEMIRLRAFNDAHLGGTDFTEVGSCINVVLCHVEKKVCFGPRGHIIMNPKGIGLGGSLMTWIISIMKERGFGDYTIEPGQLSDVDAETDGERLQRNSFYMALGFSLKSSCGQAGLDVVGGLFSAPNVDALIVSPHRLARLGRWRDFEAEQIRAFNPPVRSDDLSCQRPSPLGPIRRLVARLLAIPYCS